MLDEVIPDFVGRRREGPVATPGLDRRAGTISAVIRQPFQGTYGRARHKQAWPPPSPGPEASAPRTARRRARRAPCAAAIMLENTFRWPRLGMMKEQVRPATSAAADKADRKIRHAGNVWRQRCPGCTAGSSFFLTFRQFFHSLGRWAYEKLPVGTRLSRLFLGTRLV